MSNLPASIPKEEIVALDAIATQALATLGIGSAFERTFALAEAIDQLRTAISPAMMTRFMKLQNSALGFKTDKNPKTWNKRENKYNDPYPEAVVKDCVIEAVLRGVQTVGNQFNIISGLCYITKEGFEYKLRALKGLAQLKVNLGVPKIAAGGALVDCDASWTLNGVADSMKATLACKGDDYAGADSYIGKASRKFLKRVYERCTGTSDPDGEADPETPAQLANVPKQLPPATAPSFGPAGAATNQPGGLGVAPETNKSAPAQPDPVEEKAEADAGLAPAAPEQAPAPVPLTPPAQSKTVQADLVDPAGKVLPLRQDVANTPQAKLEAFMTNAKVSFDQFRKWAADTERLEDATSFEFWGQLPAAFCTQLLRDAKSLNKCIIRCKS